MNIKINFKFGGIQNTLVFNIQYKDMNIQNTYEYSYIIYIFIKKI